MNASNTFTRKQGVGAGVCSTFAIGALAFFGIAALGRSPTPEITITAIAREDDSYDFATPPCGAGESSHGQCAG